MIWTKGVDLLVTLIGLIIFFEVDSLNGQNR